MTEGDADLPRQPDVPHEARDAHDAHDPRGPERGDAHADADATATSDGHSHVHSHLHSQAPASAGAIIRAAREERGIDLATMAAMLKIPLRKLEALEDDRHDELPGAAFERALAQTACRALEIDPRPVLALLPHGANTLERVTGGLNTPFRERPAARVDVGEAATFLRPMVLLPALLVAAALALFFLPPSVWQRLGRLASQVTQPSTEAASSPALPQGTVGTPGLSVQPVQLAPAVPLSAEGAEASSPAAPEAASAAEAAPGPARTPMQAPTPTPQSAAPAAVVPAAAPAVAPAAAATPATPPAALPATGTVTLHASAASWVEAVDASGRTVLHRTLAAGEQVGLDGPFPLRLTVGNASGTTVTLRGHNVDLAPWVRDNVARLQLK